MALDLATLFVVSGLVTGTSGLLFLLDVRRRPDAAYGWWGLAFFCAIIPSAIYVLAGTDPSWSFLYPIGNGLVVAGAALLWVGARAFCGRKTNPVFWSAPALLTAIAPLATEDAVTAWTGFELLALGVFVFNTLAAIECWRPKGPRLQNHVVLAVTWQAGACFYLARLAAFLAFGPDDLRFSIVFGAEAATITVLLLVVVSSFSVVALGKEASELALHYAATRDGLTGILNRTEFSRRAGDLLTRLSARAEQVSVLLLDLDHFKQVNDRHGHAAGDEVLARCARAIAKCLRDEDLFCRYGGEEFALMLPGVTAEHAAMVAERIAHAIRAVAIDTGQGTIRPTASIGTMSCPAAGTDLSGLMRNADVALYRAKDSGRDRVMPFRLAA